MADLKLSAVYKSYGKTRVIHGIDLAVASGEFCVFVGPSGCGKSTLLRMIAGLESVSAGEISIGGRVVNAVPAAQRGLAMVFQSYALYPHMSVRQNMAFGLENMNMAKAEVTARVARAARMLRIDGLMDRKPGQLSGGQRQRIAIGRAVVREPKIFLFDEPLSNLDAELRVAMRAEISDLHAGLGNTMIYVTHDQIEAMTMADKIAVLRAGRVEQYGAPLDLFNAPANRFVAGFIGSPAMNFIPATIVRAGEGRRDTGGREGGDARGRDGGREGSSGMTAQTANGTLLHDLAGRFRVREGQKVELGIRPGDLKISDPEKPVTAKSGVLALRVGSVEQLGTESYLYCQTKTGEALTVHQSGQTAVRKGETLRVSVRPETLHVFDADSGKSCKIPA